MASQSYSGPACQLQSAQWRSEAYSNLGLLEEGAWVSEVLDQTNAQLKLFAQQSAEGRACVAGLSVSLARIGAARYDGNLDTLRLAITKRDWTDQVPSGETSLQAQVERWKWWQLGVSVSGDGTALSGTWKVTPKLIALMDYGRKSLIGQLRRDTRGIALDASYRQVRETSLGVLREPARTTSSLGLGVDLAWSTDLDRLGRFSSTFENLFSRVAVEGYWWADTRYQLLAPGVETNKTSFTQSNEVSGRYGQRSLAVRLPVVARLSWQPVHRVIDGVDLTHTANQWHFGLNKSWRLGAGTLDLRLQDFSATAFGYTWEVPWGREHRVQVAWVWSKWGVTKPLLLSWHFDY